MPRVTSHKARTDLYSRGLRTPNPANKSGFTFDRSKPADENDKVLIAKGQTYYRWKFKKGGERLSLTYPKRQQLTQSDFLQQVWDIEDRLAEWTVEGHGQDELESMVSDLESLRDETQEKLDNMPEGLQQGATGELLQERVDALEEMISEIENISLDSVEGCETEEEKQQEIENVQSEVSGITYNAG